MAFQDLSIYAVDLEFIRNNAEKVLKASNISYIKGAQLRGTIFQPGSHTGAISSVYTEFFIDHEEPLEVLDKFKARGKWCLGELLDGHEYLALFPVPPLKFTG